MLQKTKSMLLKVLICLCLVCCLVAALVTAAACNKSDPTVVGGEIDSRGHLILEMSDGTTKDAGLVTGSNGSNGTNGTNGKNGVGIESIDFDAATGKLVIKLTDGSEVKLTIPEYPETCPGSEDGKHVWQELHGVVDVANCMYGETVFRVCQNPGCGAKDIYQKGQPNPKNHTVNGEDGLEPHGDQPTCTKAGTTDQQCKFCGAIEKGKEVPALGHTRYKYSATGEPYRAEDYTTLPAGVVENWVPVTDDISIFCLNGGQEALVCPDCQDEVLDTKESPAPGHLLVGEWTIETQPTDSTEGLARGTCARCGETTLVLPKLTAKNEAGEEYWTHSAPNDGVCKEGQTKGVQTTYTYVYNYTDTSKDPAEPTHHDFTFVIEDDVKHVLVLSTGAKYEYQTGEISGTSPWYDDMDVPELQHFGNSPRDCTRIGYASFICANCHESILIRVRGTDHDLDYDPKNPTDPAKLVSYKAPTCEQPGYYEYNCKNGTGDDAHTGKVEIPAIGHKWKIDESKSKFDKAQKTATLVLVCENDPNHTDTIEATEVNAVETAATCEKEGSVVYTYKYRPEGALEDKEGKTTITLDRLYHAIESNGKKFEFNKDHDIADDKENPYELEDIAKALGYLKDGKPDIDALLKALAVDTYGNSHFTCTKPGYVSFNCVSGCGHKIIVAVRGEHTWKRDPSNDIKGSCEGEGTAPAEAYVCEDNPSHKKTEVTGEIPAHEWDVKIDDDGVTVHFACKNCTAKEEGTLDKSGDHPLGYVRVEPTCKPGDEGKGSITYYYTDPSGKAGTIKKDLPRVETHTFGSLTGILDDDEAEQKYTLGKFQAEAKSGAVLDDMDGFANSNPTCQKTGKITITCSACGEKLIITVKGDHKLGSEQLIHPRTCTEDGYKYQECETCQEKVEVEGSRETKYGAHKLAYTFDQRPTLTDGGKATVTCTQSGDVKEQITLPALTDSAWKHTEKASSCLAKGSDVYTYTATVKGASVEIVVTLERELGEHKLGDNELDWYSKDHLTHYWGHMCVVCNQLVVSRSEKLVQMSEPTEGEYVLSLFQAKLNDGYGERLYFTGKMDGFYLGTSADFKEAATLKIAKSGDDGYVITVGDKYLEILCVDGTDGQKHTNIVLSDSQTEGAFWKWNEEAKVFTMTANNKEYYIGTYASTDKPEGYTTMSASEITRITGDNAKNVGVSQFPAYFGTIESSEAE